MSYRDQALNIITHYLFEPWDDPRLRPNIEVAFRGQCPGPYQIVWHPGLSADLLPKFDLEFADPREATAWYLKWS
jgi:hypothetical protein